MFNVFKSLNIDRIPIWKIIVYCEITEFDWASLDFLMR